MQGVTVSEAGPLHSAGTGGRDWTLVPIAELVTIGSLIG